MKHRTVGGISAYELEPGDLPEEYKTHLYERDKNLLEPTQKKVIIRLSSELERILAPAGRLVDSSKQRYTIAHPKHNVYFNACIFDEEGKEIWFGDLDLTTERDILKDIAKKINKVLYITPEKPFRFTGLEEGKKTYQGARIVKIHPDEGA